MENVRQPVVFPLLPFALLAGVVPVVAVHGAWAISLHQGFVEHCVPYLTGCTSISRAARHGSANFLFQAVMLPYTALLAGYWLLVTAWLRALGDTASRSVVWIPRVAIVSALFLVLYATFLGSDGGFYQLMRRYGVTVYFSFNFLAQLFFTRRLIVLRREGRLPVPSWAVTTKLALCAAVLALGVANVVGAAVLEDNDAFENVIEWNASLLMTAFYFVTAWIWRGHRFDAALRLR